MVSRPALPRTRTRTRTHIRTRILALAMACLSLAVAGCASLSESTQQNVMVQTVLDHREIFGVGCVLYNDVGKWFVTTPARVTLRKSATPLRIDCRKEGAASSAERLRSRSPLRATRIRS